MGVLEKIKDIESGEPPTSSDDLAAPSGPSR